MSLETLTLKSIQARPVVLTPKRPVVARITALSDWPLIVEVREAAEENLGWFSLQDRPPEQRDQILAVLCRSLLPAAERELPADLPNREGVLTHLRALVDLCCA